ncbi:hypothetical protein LTR62_006630 [Meristemomyces frigidus]|uniref:Endonuclease/exonuclease/phosphatase domain-containing protein n=1 Tax=Meristemomyces frigidus TaxID=1508187 RepID=A0AAN7YJA3_9PEZI|nr:hypothetical protein LTR62_006630 [Meristemomyces frigidus]
MTVSPSTGADVLPLPTSLRVLSLNCWGLKFLSTHRAARLAEIGHQLSLCSPPPEIVGLQECWTQADYLCIRELTQQILPHGKFYFSGIFGGGLAILSKWPIEESSMYRYSLNGRPQAFFRGDWYVGKGVASARIRVGPRRRDVVEVFCTHLHAPYEREPNDSYLCHRTAQAWEIAKMMRHARERGHAVVGLGDFNMIPRSLAHRIVEAHGGGVRDVWRVVKPESAVGAAEDSAEKARVGVEAGVPSAGWCLEEHGTTCDSRFNTWRWSKPMQKALAKGQDTIIDPGVPDHRAKRLDYIFFASPAGQDWRVEAVKVGFTMRHPTLLCSLSDHFSIEATLVRQPSTESKRMNDDSEQPMITPLPPSTYDEILAVIATYNARERKQRRWRLAHFVSQVLIAIACLIAVWWSPRNYVSFILMLISTLGLSAGVLDGLMGGLFVGSEIRALKEFEFEIRGAREMALRESGGGGWGK